MATILVTGAAGFIGSHTVDQLLAASHRVIGIDNFRSGHRRNLAKAIEHPAFQFFEADVSEQDSLATLVAETRPEAMIHLAALVSVQDSIANPELNYHLNLAATHRVAEVARQFGVDRVVFASSAAVYGDSDRLPLDEDTGLRPISPYGGAKLASEALLLAHGAAFGFSVRCQRYFNVFGPRQDPGSPYSGVISIFDQCYREHRPVTVFGDGQQTRDFISVHDVARANVLAATRPHLPAGVANICTGNATSLLRLTEMFARHYAEPAAPEFRQPRPADIVHSVGQAERAAVDLNFRATWSIAEGVAELITSAESS